MENLIKQRQKQFRTVGLVLFVAAAGLLISRILAIFLDTVVDEKTSDVIFSTLMQVGFLLIAPYLIYKLSLKKSFRGIMEFSNFRRVDWKIILLCIPLGFCALMISSGISTIWYTLLTMFGYSGGGGSEMPETFSVWLLLLDIFITAVLPAVCEEFTNRGGFLTTLRGSFSEGTTILLGGLAFGLFHQNITQFFYTFCFGMAMVTLVLKTKSVWPAVLIHFINNAVSVYSDYATAYSLPFSGIFTWIDGMLVSNFGLLAFLFLAVTAVGIILFWLVLKLADKKKKSEGATITAIDGEEITPPLEDKTLYKPTTADCAFYFGAIVITVITTVVTFYWGLV